MNLRQNSFGCLAEQYINLNKQKAVPTTPDVFHLPNKQAEKQTPENSISPGRRPDARINGRPSRKVFRTLTYGRGVAVNLTAFPVGPNGGRAPKTNRKIDSDTEGTSPLTEAVFCDRIALILVSARRTTRERWSRTCSVQFRRTTLTTDNNNNVERSNVHWIIRYLN